MRQNWNFRIPTALQFELPQLKMLGFQQQKKIQYIERNSNVQPLQRNKSQTETIPEEARTFKLLIKDIKLTSLILFKEIMDRELKGIKKIMIVKNKNTNEDEK